MERMNELALFAGAGGGLLASEMLGWRTICAVEWEPYPACVLAQRQNDGLLPPFPIWDDVRTFDGRPWRGRVDVVSGGFPCQDISAAGKGAGIGGERSGMWMEMARIIGEVRPRFVFVENSPMLTSRGLGRVLGDLAALGYDAEWGVLGAADVGAPHRRDRIWIVAYARYDKQGRQEKDIQPKREKSVGPIIGDVCSDIPCQSHVAHPHESRHDRSQESGVHPTPHGQGATDNAGNGGGAPRNVAHTDQSQRAERSEEKHTDISSPNWWKSEPNVGRVAHGVAARVDRLKAIGNGQVPQCAAEAWRILHGRLMDTQKQTRQGEP